MIPDLRLYEISLANYLKYEVLPVYFLEHIQNESLEFDPTLGGYVADPSVVPSPTSQGRGWFPFDESMVGGKIVVDTSQEQTSRVSVVGASSYTIDYVNGVIKNPDSTPSSVSFYWNYVSLIRGWPGEVPPPLPVVAVDLDVSQKEGYQLGPGDKDTIGGSVYIFATDEAEKKDITYIIQGALHNKSLTVMNFHEGSYINYDGTFNTGFTPTSVEGLGSGLFLDVVARMDGPRASWSELNRHRSRVDFQFEVYKSV